MKLEFHDISKSYGSNKALQHFSATFTPGIYALLGPNGAGKTTLMNILTDNLRADSGTITFAENDTPVPVRELGCKFRQKIGYMPQNAGLYGNFTAAQFLWYMAALKDVGKGLPRGERKKYVQAKIDEVLEATELCDVANRKISALSGGMKQRLALAQAVLGDPDVLVLDEPTAGLDPRQRIEIRNYISKMAFRKIVLIATHVVSDVESVARSVLMLKKGVLTYAAPAEELIKKIDGKVWQVECAKEEIAAWDEKAQIVDITNGKSPDMALLRILSDTRPTPESTPVPPTLEDFYLYENKKI